MNSVSNILFLAIIAGLCGLFGYIYWQYPRIVPQESVIVEKVDTIYVRDTITAEKPVYVRSYVRDTIRVQVNDTIYISLPREVKVYEDSLYRAEVSGYNPSLDRIDVYAPTRVITRAETKTISVPMRKRWGIGLQVGYGCGYHSGTFFSSPYIGVGVSYNLLTF